MNTRTFLQGVSIGVVGLCLMQSPSCAEGAVARAIGSSQIILMNGASQSVNVEMSAPTGTMFGQGSISVSPVLVGNLSSNSVQFARLEVNPGPLTVVPADSSFTTSAAAILSSGLPLADVVSIIRAGSGVDGLE